MTRYRWDGDRFVNRATGEPMETVERVCLPSVIKDVTYKCPITRQEVTSRSQRREVMKRHNVREVEPSEYQPVYQTERWARRQRGEHEPRKPVDLGEGYQRLSKADLPKKIRRSVERLNT